LGKAAIDTSLLPAARAGVIGQLGAWVKRPRAAESAWGIDLSASGIKGARVTWDAKNDLVSLAAFDVVEHAAPLGSVEGEEKRRNLLAESVQKFVERNKIEEEPVSLGFPGTLALGRFFALPPVEAKRVDELMKYEARQQVPIPLEQLHWDYFNWYSGKGSDRTPTAALLVAAKQHHVQQRLVLFEDAGVRIQAVQSDCVALYNFYQYAIAGRQQRADAAACVMLLDVGADGTNFVVGDEHTLWFRSVPRGGDDLNRAAAQQLAITFAAAEQLKRNPAKARHVSKLHDAWKPTFAQLHSDLRDTLDAYRATGNHPIAAIYALGGSFGTHGLHRHLVST
jgi:type IV pilus assembly protein PilM